MIEQSDFFRHVLDSLTEHVVVIDPDGTIRYVNQPWMRFCAANGGPADLDWRGINYLEVCRQADAEGDEFGRLALEGIRGLAAGREEHYALEYPCHSPGEERWFLAQMTSLNIGTCRHIVISHHDITERRQAEQRAERMARTDGLIGIANRACLDEFLEQEWLRAMRNGRHVSVLLFDIDAFKPFNDHYGHQAGDECLRKLGRTVQSLFSRASELLGRYGGEEFLVVLGEVGPEQAERQAERVLETVRGLGIAHERSAAAAMVTVSIGVAALVPPRDSDPSTIVEAADRALYEAKSAGRNQYRVAAVAARIGAA